MEASVERKAERVGLITHGNRLIEDTYRSEMEKRAAARNHVAVAVAVTIRRQIKGCA